MGLDANLPPPIMSADRALALLGLLTDAGLDVWVGGGWGVDALVGYQTRDHGDLDLGIVRPDLGADIDLLGTVGYLVTDDQYREVAVQLTHAEGHRVDLHPACRLPAVVPSRPSSTGTPTTSRRRLPGASAVGPSAARR